MQSMHEFMIYIKKKNCDCDCDYRCRSMLNRSERIWFHLTSRLWISFIRGITDQFRSLTTSTGDSFTLVFYEMITMRVLSAESRTHLFGSLSMQLSCHFGWFVWWSEEVLHERRQVRDGSRADFFFSLFYVVLLRFLHNIRTVVCLGVILRLFAERNWWFMELTGCLKNTLLQPLCRYMNLNFI